MLFVFVFTLVLFFFTKLRRSFGYFFPRFLFYNYKYDGLSPTIASYVSAYQRRGNEVVHYAELSTTNFSSQMGIGSGFLFNNCFSISRVSMPFSKVAWSHKYHFFRYFTEVLFVFFTISTFDNNLNFSSPVRISAIFSDFDFKFNAIIFVVNSKLFVK